ncbi:hypothetical protein AB0215_28815, partial [Klebsiella pneumoniae]
MQKKHLPQTGGLRRIDYSDLFTRLIVAFYALAGIMQPAPEFSYTFFISLARFMPSVTGQNPPNSEPF